MKAEKFSEIEEILENIDIPEDLDRLVLESVERGYRTMGKNKSNKKGMMIKRAAVSLGIIAAGGAISFPVRAIVNSLVQERMEQVPAKEIEKIVEDLDRQQVGADTYSRNYFPEEEKRLEELKTAYSQGTFPEKDLRQENTADAGLTDELYFAADTSTFYLPERELTDEELLQIIDFETKRNYGVNKEFEEMQKKASEEVQKAGGITEADAKEAGKEWAQKLYGVSGDWMDTDYKLYVNDYTKDYTYYNLVFGENRETHYFFDIDSRDGSLMNTMLINNDEEKVGTAAAKEKMETLRAKAEEILTGKLDKKDTYERVVCSYLENEGNLSGSDITFFFIKADESAYLITMSVTKETFTEYCPIDNYTEYTDAVTENLESTRQEGSVLSGPEGEYVFEELQ